MRSTTGEWYLGQPGYADVRPQIRRAGREVWRYLPAWMFLFYGCLLLNAQLTNFDPPRLDLAYTAAFPLAVFALFYSARAARAPEVGNRWLMLLATVGLAIALPLANLSYHRASPLSIPALRTVYELSNFVWAGLLLAHALRRHPSHAALFFGTGLLYGAMLENGGIVLGFFSEHHLELTQVGPLRAPLATMIGWCVVLYMATFVIWELRRHIRWLRRSAALSALAVGTTATLLDLQIDPIATAAGCWVWHESLPPAFHGVPLVNFVAWMCALFPFAYFQFRFQERERIGDGAAWTGRQLWISVAAVPAILAVAAALFMSAIGLLEGIEGPSWTLLNRFLSSALAVIG